MKKIGFITCSDLSRYFPSRKSPLLTHDDQIACDYLQEKGFLVEPIIWGTPIEKILAQEVILLIVRSPWDYMDNKVNFQTFLSWLEQLAEAQIPVANSVEILRWNFDKHYLKDLAACHIPVLPTIFLETQDPLEKMEHALKIWKNIVVKPCISAGARDTFLIQNFSELEALLAGKMFPFLSFDELRLNRAFMIQPFIDDIQSKGEWSLVFLHEQYSHAVLKLPKKGGWLVQDELGGSVTSLDPPDEILEIAVKAFPQLASLLKTMFSDSCLLYARLDIIPGGYVGEVELIEPELFFLDRRNQRPNDQALLLFYQGIERRILAHKGHF